MDNNLILSQSVELLKAVLLESPIESDMDEEIYNFLKEIGELPDGYVPYWE